MAKVSVVIPTLGGYSLVNTIKKLNEGSLKPDEILICIPEDLAQNIPILIASNIKKVICEERGQVIQRSLGFMIAKNDLVLQIDDDIEVDKQCLENLVLTAFENANAAVGPKFYDIKTNKYFSYLTPNSSKKSILEKLVYFVINGKEGFEQGKISKCGINMGVTEGIKNPIGVEWLPGGCILHWKKNLVLENFYPNKGKAFAEDLFHSKILRNKGIQLIRNNQSIVYIDFQSGQILSPFIFVKSYIKYSSVMNSLSTGLVNKTRLNTFLLLNFMLLIISKLTKKNEFN